MRWLRLVLVLALLAFQYPLWWGKGGWLHARELDNQIETQRDLNAGLRLRNAALEAELKDLEEGTEAIEERARHEMGLVASDEVYVKLIESP